MNNILLKNDSQGIMTLLYYFYCYFKTRIFNVDINSYDYDKKFSMLNSFWHVYYLGRIIRFFDDKDRIKGLKNEFPNFSVLSIEFTDEDDEMMKRISKMDLSALDSDEENKEFNLVRDCVKRFSAYEDAVEEYAISLLNAISGSILLSSVEKENDSACQRLVVEISRLIAK